MKSIIKRFSLYTAIAIVMLQASCKKDIFTQANNNPNSPNTVLPSNILPGVETGLAYTQGGDFARFSSLLTQQDFGLGQQTAAYYTYIFTSVDFDIPWSNMFTTVMGNDKDMMHKADSSGLDIYSGISRILMAYSLQGLVDEWGSVPYSKALLGDEEHHPSYDNDAALYDTIANLIDVGITQLSSSNPGALTPGVDDLIYGGDPSLWIKFGHAIKARLYIHQSKGNSTMAAKALDEANTSFSDPSESCQFLFGTTQNFANPIFTFNNQRYGYIDYGSGFFTDLLTGLNDPRIGLTTDPTYSDAVGIGIGNYYGNINGHVEFIMYEEMEFLKAEAILRTTGDYAAAQTHYQNGIKASMQKLGVSDADVATYITANGTLPATNANAAIAAVSLQEYIALYQNPEAWTLWRRTGSPQLDPIAGTNGIPRRFLYPQSEISLNGQNTPDATLFSPKIFWDK